MYGVHDDGIYDDGMVYDDGVYDDGMVYMMMMMMVMR